MSRERLSRDQERAIAILLTSPSMSEAARALRLHPSTVRHWVRQPLFSAAYREAREELLGKCINKLQDSLFSVVDTLVADLSHAQPAVRHRAAGMLIDAATRGTEIVTLGRQVAELQARLEAAVGAPNRLNGRARV